MERSESELGPGTAAIDFNRDVHCVLGLPIDAIDMHGAVRRVRAAVRSSKRCFISTVNLNFAMAARTDAAFRDSVLHSDMVLADGMPLVWVARLLRLPIRERVSGAGLFECLASQPGPPISVFFFGGPDGAAESACQRINDTSTGLRGVGFDSPGYGDVEAMSGSERIDRINDSGAAMVVVALGAKKGQAWIERNRARLQAPVLCHLGAVVNFTAGTIRRAPPLLQALGGEWVWRIMQEPELWRRYWNDCASFLRVLWSEVLPHAIRRRSCDDAARTQEPAGLAIQETAEHMRLALSGTWTERELGPLRRALSLSQERSTRLTLCLEGVSCVDNAFIALMMLAHGAESASARLLIGDARPTVAAAFRRNGASFLLAPDCD